MNAFSIATNLMFRDANIGADAVYFPGGAEPGLPVRVITRAPDRFANFGEGRFVAEAILIDVRTSDVEILARGDTFEIGGVLYEVRSDPIRDSERLVWAAEVRALG